MALSIPDHSFAFALALFMMLLLLLIECLGALIGFSNWALEDVDLDSAEISSEASSLKLGWIFAPLFPCGLPILITLQLYLLFFGMSGLILQNLSLAYYEIPLPIFWAILLAFAISFPIGRMAACVIAYFFPKETTEAVSWHSLVGEIAEITLGEAKMGLATTAKARDHLGKMHHFLIEPEKANETFVCGDKVLIVKCVKGRFYGRFIT